MLWISVHIVFFLSDNISTLIQNNSKAEMFINCFQRQMSKEIDLKKILLKVITLAICIQRIYDFIVVFTLI